MAELGVGAVGDVAFELLPVFLVAAADALAVAADRQQAAQLFDVRERVLQLHDLLRQPFRAAELRARINAGIRVLTLQERLAQRVVELEQALANVNQLSGLLPICSYCKRVRGDQDYLEQVESYIADRTDAEFSHGVCPACFEKMRADFDR